MRQIRILQHVQMVKTPKQESNIILNNVPQHNYFIIMYVITWCNEVVVLTYII